MRAFVLLGILLIVGSIFGAKWAFEQSSIPSDKEKAEAEAKQLPSSIIAWGTFDVEPGVAQLSPKQLGDIVKLAVEHTKVKEGDVLLQIDDEQAKLKVEEAKADVDAAKQLVAESKLLPQHYKLQKDAQQSMVTAMDRENDKLKEEEKTKLDLFRPDTPIQQTYRNFFASGRAWLAEKKKAEEAKLEQLKLQNPDLKIAFAEADLKAKQVRLRQTQAMLKHYQVVAPSAGTVLRVHVRKGETLGPNPRSHAIDFLPDSPTIVRAEVLQEWGRHVEEGQAVVIEDDTYNGQKWQGKVKKISGWYAPVRSPVIEPFRYNDVRTLECIITITDGPEIKRIGQRVRAKIKIKKQD